MSDTSRVTSPTVPPSSVTTIEASCAPFIVSSTCIVTCDRIRRSPNSFSPKAESTSVTVATTTLAAPLACSPGSNGGPPDALAVTAVRHIVSSANAVFIKVTPRNRGNPGRINIEPGGP